MKMEINSFQEKSLRKRLSRRIPEEIGWIRLYKFEYKDWYGIPRTEKLLYNIVIDTDNQKYIALGEYHPILRTYEVLFVGTKELHYEVLQRAKVLPPNVMFQERGRNYRIVWTEDGKILEAFVNDKGIIRKKARIEEFIKVEDNEGYLIYQNTSKGPYIIERILIEGRRVKREKIVEAQKYLRKGFHLLIRSEEAGNFIFSLCELKRFPIDLLEEEEAQFVSWDCTRRAELPFIANNTWIQIKGKDGWRFGIIGEDKVEFLEQRFIQREPVITVGCEGCYFEGYKLTNGDIQLIDIAKPHNTIDRTLNGIDKIKALSCEENLVLQLIQEKKIVALMFLRRTVQKSYEVAIHWFESPIQRLLPTKLKNYFFQINEGKKATLIEVIYGEVKVLEENISYKEVLKGLRR